MLVSCGDFLVYVFVLTSHTQACVRGVGFTQVLGSQVCNGGRIHLEGNPLGEQPTWRAIHLDRQLHMHDAHSTLMRTRHWPASLTHEAIAVVNRHDVVAAKREVPNFEDALI